MEVIERHRILAPVPYRLGWSRSSCMTCIYNSRRISSPQSVTTGLNELGKLLSMNKPLV